MVTESGKSAKPAAKKTTANKAVTKKPAAKKTAVKKTPAKKAVVKKPSAPRKIGATRAASTPANQVQNVEFKDRAVKAVNDGKARTGEAIGTLSKMIESSAKTIDEHVGAKYGDYARSAADAVSSFGDKINSKDVEELTDEARQFVRKSPAVAIGAAAAVGFVVARLIKAGMSNSETNGDDEV